MIDAGVVAAARVTHDTGDVDDVAAASPDSQRSAVADLCSAPAVEEAFVLSTCNRAEAYVVAREADSARAALEAFFSGVDDEVVVHADHDDSLRHLLRIAAGLESVVVGEDQVLGQVRTAYEDARSAGGVGATLEIAVTKAIHVGERARTETAINEGVVSLGSAAAELAADEVDLTDATGLVVGAGEMGGLVARSLAARGIAEVIVANRTVPHAEHVVAEVEADGSAVGLDALEVAAARADVVVTATGSADPLLEPDHLATGPDRDGERIVVDLGQPRDVAPRAADLPDVAVYDLDDLESRTDRTRDRRADAAAEVEALVDREFALLCEQYKRARADEVIAAMYESAERIKHREVETALSRLESTDDLSASQREVVRSMADALVSQLLAPPTESLREAAAEDDWETINTALQLFDPEFGPEFPGSVPDHRDAATDSHVEAVDDD